MILRACFVFFLATLANGDANLEDCLNYLIYPVSYDLTITPHISKFGKSYYDGNIVITIIANAPDVKIIELAACNIIINDEIRVINTRNNENIINTHRPYSYYDNELKIFLIKPLEKYTLYKHTYDVMISFRKYLNANNDTGVFLLPSEYEHHTTRYNKKMLITRLSPHRAQYFFPCFDNLLFESGFKFKVIIPTGEVKSEIYNTSLVIAEEQRKEQKRHHIIHNYATSPQVSLHQVGFHLSDYISQGVSSSMTNDTLFIWAPEHKFPYSELLHFGIDIIDIIHRYCGNQFRRPLVNGVINIVPVPKILDGFEPDSWNLLTNGENRLPNNFRLLSIKQKEKMFFELAQQLTRVWLGNPGEPERTRWKQQWFKEGLATYLANFFLARYFDIPQEHYMIHTKHQAMSEDWIHSTPHLSSFNEVLLVDIPRRYKHLVSMKTASILWMLENWVGTTRFHEALIHYINTRRGQSITLDDFRRQLDLDTVECQTEFLNGRTSSTVLNSWFNQQGYPVINVQVHRDRNPNAIQLTQHRFSFVEEHVDNYNYLIPVSYIVQHHANCFNCYQPRFTIGVESYSFEENLDGGWIILNRNASGYYRVNYDPLTWNLIANTLHQNHETIHYLNRAQIVNDMFALYVANYTSIDQAMAVLSYLNKETNEEVWRAAKQGFEYLDIIGTKCNMTKRLYEEWKRFMQHQIGPVYDTVVSFSDEKSRFLRTTIQELACSVEYQPCLFRINKIYRGFQSHLNVLHPDVREVCYHNSMKAPGSIIQTTNIFEEEERLTAERRYQMHQKFWYMLPVGTDRPLPMTLTTTAAPVSNCCVNITQASVLGPTSSATDVFAAFKLLQLFVILMYFV